MATVLLHTILIFMTFYDINGRFDFHQGYVHAKAHSNYQNIRKVADDEYYYEYDADGSSEKDNNQINVKRKKYGTSKWLRAA